MISAIKKPFADLSLNRSKSSILNIVSIIIIAACSIAIVYCIIKSHTGISEILSVIVFSFFYALLPGYSFARKVVNKRTLSQYVAFSAFFSLAFLIAFYFLDEMLVHTVFSDTHDSAALLFSNNGIFFGSYAFKNSYYFSCFGGPVLSIISGIYLCKDLSKTHMYCIKASEALPLLAVIMIMVSLSFGAIYMNTSFSPYYTGTTSEYHDVLWLAGNDAAIAKGWPAEGFQYYGRYINTNVGANIIRGMMSRITGIPSVRVFGIYSSFIAMPFIVFSINALSEYFSNKNRKALFITISFIFVSFFSLAFLHINSIESAGQEAQATSFASAIINIVHSPNGIDLSVPVIALATIVIIDSYNVNKLKPLNIITILIVIAILTIGKYVFTVCIIGALIGTIVIRLFQIKQRKGIVRVILILIIICIIFAFMYFLAAPGGQLFKPATETTPIYEEGTVCENYQNDEYIYDHVYSEFDASANTRNNLLFKGIKTTTGIPPEYDGIIDILLIPLHFILQLIFVSIPFIIWVVARIKRFGAITNVEMLVAGIAISGLIMYYILRVDGMGQVYFFYCASVFVNLIGAGWIYDNFKKAKKVIKVLIVVAFIIGLCSTLGRTTAFAKSGFAKAVLASDKAFCIESIPDYNCLTDYEYEAMEWIRNNTPSDAVISIDRHFHMKPPYDYVPEPNQAESRYYYYTAYSERQAFLGAWAYLPRTKEMQDSIIKRLKTNDAIYSNNCINRYEIMDKNNISYIVVSRFVHPDLVIEDNGFSEVFSNRDITIYKLKKDVKKNNGI